MTKSAEIWRHVDFGNMIQEVEGEQKKLIEAILRAPQISACESLKMQFNAPIAHVMALILSMPNLRDLFVNISESSWPSTALWEIIDRLRGPELLKEKVTTVHVLKAIESLSRLENLDLNVRATASAVVPIRFPSTLRRVNFSCHGDAAPLFSAGTFNSITSLALSPKIGAAAAIRACPRVRSLKLGSDGLVQDDIDTLANCPDLEDLEISTPEAEQSLAFYGLAGSRFESLRVLSLGTSTNGFIGLETLFRAAPNIVTLDLENSVRSASDFRALSSLKKLESLGMDLEAVGDGEENEYSEALEEFGNSCGCRLKRLEVLSDRDVLAGFFRSHRCHGLRKLVIDFSDTSEEAGLALAENVHDSLEILEANFMSGETSSEFVIPLLAKCTRLSKVTIGTTSCEILRRIGAESRAPLRSFCLNLFDDETEEDDMKALIPALQTVKQLGVPIPRLCTIDCVIGIALSCPALSKLFVRNLDAASLSAIQKLLPSRIHLHIYSHLMKP